MSGRPIFRPVGLAIGAAVMLLLLETPGAQQAQGRPVQPPIGARVKAVLTVDGLKFKDSNGNGRLDPYEDWRLGGDERVRDLVSKMTLEDKAGMMLIDSLSPGTGGAGPAGRGRISANRR